VSPKLSVVIPAYNAAQLVADAVASIRAQGLADMEILLVDDGSTDDTAAVARSLSVSVLAQPDRINRGPAAARNLGIRASSAGYLAFLDVDDEWPPDAIPYLLASLENDRALQVALGHVQCFICEPGDSSAYREHGPPFVTFLLGAAVYRRAVFEHVGLFDEALREGEDVDWFMRAREAAVEIRVHPQTTLHYRRRPGSITYGRGAELRTLARMLERSIARRRAANVGAAESLPPLARASSASVSVVVAVRNGERYLAEALESILAGELLPSEILVVDGGSTDRSVRIAEAFPSVRVVAQKGSGIANAYNQGIQEARGDLLAFLSYDDRWDSRKLALQIRHMEAHGECDCVVSRVRHFLEPGETPPEGFRRNLLDEDRPAFIMETLLARRRVFERVGGFDPSFTVAEDVDWFARAKDAGVRIDVLPDVLVQKRVHSANTSLNARDNDAQLLRAARASVRRKRLL